MDGKLTCKLLKSVRKQIADANNIDYHPHACHYEGKCRGTCPACEAEVRYLESQLSLRQMAGKVIKIVGLAAGISSLPICAAAQTTNAASAHQSTESCLLAKLEKKGVQVRSASNSKTKSITKQVKKSNSQQVKKSNSKSVKGSNQKQANKSSKVVKKYGYKKSHYKQPVKSGKTTSKPTPRDSAKIFSYPDRDGDMPYSVFIKFQRKAEYPGGLTALHDFLQSNVRYPKSALETHRYGQVIVEFLIEKDGSVANVHVVRSVDPALDKEAMRVVKLMKPWKPARQGSKKARCHFRIVFTFLLEDGKPSTGVYY